MNDDLMLFVGVDWATEELEVYALDPSGGEAGARAFKRSGGGLAELRPWLLKNARRPWLLTATLRPLE
ncbi:MAG: hypothetical protein NXI31_25085 [bacterium]|nr:hypothetical protein [bacterium]